MLIYCLGEIATIQVNACPTDAKTVQSATIMKNSMHRAKVTVMEMQPLFARALQATKTVPQTTIASQDCIATKKKRGHLKRIVRSSNKLEMCAQMITSA